MLFMRSAKCSKRVKYSRKLLRSSWLAAGRVTGGGMLWKCLLVLLTCVPPFVWGRMPLQCGRLRTGCTQPWKHCNWKHWQMLSLAALYHKCAGRSTWMDEWCGSFINVLLFDNILHCNTKECELIDFVIQVLHIEAKNDRLGKRTKYNR